MIVLEDQWSLLGLCFICLNTRKLHYKHNPLNARLVWLNTRRSIPSIHQCQTAKIKPLLHKASWPRRQKSLEIPFRCAKLLVIEMHHIFPEKICLFSLLRSWQCKFTVFPLGTSVIQKRAIKPSPNGVFPKYSLISVTKIFAVTVKGLKPVTSCVKE